MAWILVIAAGVAFWGVAFGAARRGFLRAGVKARAAGLGREKGALYCPDCASKLTRDPEAAPTGPAAALCAGCGGRWVDQAAIAGTAKRRNKELEWFTDRVTSQATPLPCPGCAAAMETGGFSRMRFTVSRCGPCAGFWFSRVDWVSCTLEL